ncbi:tripartite tricarboxylate transporter permease [Alisedimentitalea sp. MJ-SS2]|uniref:tripartite tricarboxylate transporter permease n=1 Tax=Aliisedimentitalea sp. MJ-SS2 TaxID=3049795 RepID=UPI00290F34BD|nr:tripartite tricarboxylate transporter permease [Alisedimentitalea sp. MJ-SS2]MDU8929665.1 tripartite tricarboxylate transporter permease [Alisedimentitalea sp. MJ-SS2]
MPNPESNYSAESANNAVTGSAMIPLLALAIPGDPPTAILLGALLIQGVTPGPMISTFHPEVVYSIYLILFVALVFLAIIASFAIKPITHVLRVPKNILFPIILVMCVAGSYSVRSNIFDVYVMFGAGVLGYVLRLFSVPIAPHLIAFILTSPLEEALRQALIGSNGSLMVFLEKPISAGFLILAAVMVASVTLRQRKQRDETALPR